MLLAIFMFSFGDALGKFMVATYSVGQLLWLRACAALLVLSPLIWRHAQQFLRLERPWLQLLRVVLSTLEVAAFFLATVYLPLADVITYYLACPIFVTALSAIVLREQVGWRRWTRDPDRLLRRADRAAALGADRQLAGDDRARRQPVVCAADADHALAARDARYRDGVVAIRRHLPAGRADVAVRLGDAGRSAASALFAAAGCISVSALLCVNRSLKLAPASVVVPYQYSMIVWAVMFGIVVFGDVPSPATIIGAAIIIAAGLYIFLRERELGREERWSIRRRDVRRIALASDGDPSAPGRRLLRGHRSPSRECTSDRSRFFVELAQFFSDDQTLRDRRKQSTGLEEPSASKRCSSTPVHWKPHFSRMLRDAGLATRAPAISMLAGRTPRRR